MTRASTPGSLSTSTLMVWVSGFSSRFSSEYAEPGWVITFIRSAMRALVRGMPLLRSFFAAELDHADRDHQDRGGQHQHRPLQMTVGLNHDAGEDHDQHDGDDLGPPRLELADAADLHPDRQPLAVPFRQREHEADGDAVGEDHQ